MRCPACAFEEDKVIDSRSTKEGTVTRRRRECLKCAHRFTTYEYVEPEELAVVKKDGRREDFERRKILEGILKACEKRPIPRQKIEDVTDAIVAEIQNDFRTEIPSSEIGERVMKQLRDLDEVAYVRFASVYRHFEDITEFMQELRNLIRQAKADKQ
ncbi:MAG: transcriptional regulator NrdR [bacterium]